MEKTESLKELSSVAGGSVEGAMVADSDVLAEEEEFRAAVREILNQYSKKSKVLSDKEKLEEQKLRNSIRKYISEKKSNDPSMDTTWANVLRDVLNKIIPQMRISYTQLQTNMDERLGFKQKVMDTFKELFYQIDNPEEQELKEQEQEQNNLSETEKLKINIKSDNPNFFDDINDGSEKESVKKKDTKDIKDTKIKVSQDSYEVGQVFADEFLNSTSGQVQNAYSSKLSGPEDRELFKKTFFDNLLSWIRIWDTNKPVSQSSQEVKLKELENSDLSEDFGWMDEEIEIDL
jgi:hypothetical protein